MKQEIIFNVKNLRITKTGNIYATEGIKNVFDAVFDFVTSDWAGIVKTAVFENADGEKEKRLLTDDRCEIPDSFFKRSGVCYVSVFAGDLMVTNKAAIIVVNAGYTLSEGDNEAKNYFEQILRYFDSTNANAKEYAELAEKFAIGISSDPESLKKNARYYAELAKEISLGIPGQVDDAKKRIDTYVAQKEESLRGRDGNVIFPRFKVEPPSLLMKNNADETGIEFRLNGSELEYKWKEVT